MKPFIITVCKDIVLMEDRVGDVVFLDESELDELLVQLIDAKLQMEGKHVE